MHRKMPRRRGGGDRGQKSVKVIKREHGRHDEGERTNRNVATKAGRNTARDTSDKWRLMTRKLRAAEREVHDKALGSI